MFPGRKKMAHSQLKSLLTLSRAVRVEGALAPPGGSLSHPHLVERVIYSYTSPIILQEKKNRISNTETLLECTTQVFC